MTLLRFLLPVALFAAAAPALADRAVDLLNQSGYWLKLANSSLELSNKVSSRKDKCIWSRQAQSEMVKAEDYLGQAVQAANADPTWSGEQRTRLAGLHQDMITERQRTDKLVQDRC